MVSSYEIERQLKAIGFNHKGWGRSEIRELQNLIVSDETIHFCINGYYQSGFAMLCITDRRAILIDKKPFYLTVEDINYDMIGNVIYDGRFFDATIKICTQSKILSFTCLGRGALKKATSYLQQQVLGSKRESWLSHSGQVGSMVPMIGKNESDQVLESVKSYSYKATSPYMRAFILSRRSIGQNRRIQYI